MLRTLIISIAVSIAALLTASCSMPETKIYSVLVSGEKADAGRKADAAVNITVHSSRYLSQSYIAYRNSPYQVEIARYGRWDAPPADMVRDAFRDSIAASGMVREVKTSAITPAGFYSLDISLKQFERRDEGEASFGQMLLEVKLISPEGKELYADTLSRNVRLEDKSFLALAKGLSSALTDVVSQVKTGMVKSLQSIR